MNAGELAAPILTKVWVKVPRSERLLLSDREGFRSVPLMRGVATNAGVLLAAPEACALAKKQKLDIVSGARAVPPEAVARE